MPFSLVGVLMYYLCMSIRNKKWKPLHIVGLEYILAALKHFDGNRTQTAKAIKISLRCLRMKIDQAYQLGYEVEPPKTGVEEGYCDPRAKNVD